MSSALHAITTTRPGCMMILLDQSESMRRPSGITNKSRAQALADAVNELILEQITWCRKDDRIVDRFHFGLIGFGGTKAEARLQSPNGKALLTATELANCVLTASSDDDADPIWFEPKADGITPMHSAFEIAASLLEEWTAQHRDSYPPVVCNISDGEWSDPDPTPAIARVASIKTDIGTTRLFNATIRPDAPTVEYPASTDEVTDGFSRWLFQHSSVVPAEMCSMLAERFGRRLVPGARGLIQNGQVSQISQMLYVGSAAVLGNVRG